MTRLAVRVPLFLALAAAVVAAAWFLLEAERQATVGRAGLEDFRATAARAARRVTDIQTGLQAYVAVGQGGEFWRARVADDLRALKDDLATLRHDARESAALNDLDAVASAFEDIVLANDRAQRLVRAGELDSASRLVYGEAGELLRSSVSRIEAAVRAEAQPLEVRAQLRRQQEIYTAGGVAAVALLVSLALLPTGRRKARAAATAVEREASATRAGPRTAAGTSVLGLEGPHLAAEPAPGTPAQPDPALASTPAPAGSAHVPAAASAAIATAAPPTRDRRRAAELKAMADLCTDFARLLDSQELPALLERGARLIDASGFIVWVGDPMGRELRAALAHGYAPEAIARLPAIPRHADNATAAAWRAADIQVVQTNGMSPGALVAPLLTPAGCIGVLAAEVRHGREESQSVRALTRILAAQISTLVSVPTEPADTRSPRAEAQHAAR